MIVLGVLAFIVLLALLIVGFVLASKLRRQKDYERSLDMVTMLIHLPPISEDIEGGSRDERDITDETISRAQTIYNILASTAHKGWKSSFYGQEHFGFEIVANKGFVNYYAAMPAHMAEVVNQAITSAYPATRLEEVTDHNIFNDVSKLAGVAGGEMDLKEPYAYPIATYQEAKRDAMQSILNSMSNINNNDGVAIQILMRPAHHKWTQQSLNHAQKIKKDRASGKAANPGGALMVKDLASALWRPPSADNNQAEQNVNTQLTNTEQHHIEAIDDKARYSGYETLIRVVASSDSAAQANGVLNNVVASFSLFDAPGKNGFKFVPAKDIGQLTTDYILRSFPQQKRQNVLNSVELATLFHFPDHSSIPTSQLRRQDSKQVDGPRNMPETGLMLGYNEFRGNRRPIRLDIQDRRRHMYAVGQTGTGKSTFLENLAMQDMLNGDGFAFVDPHGDTAEKLLSMVPKERAEDVIYFAPGEMDYPMGLNLFEYDNPDQKDFIIQETLSMLYKLYDPQHQGIMGPRYENIFRNAALAIMADPAGGTFVDIPKLFRDSEFLKQKLQHVTDPTVLEYWQKEYPASQKSSDAGEITAWFVSKFGAFLSNEMMRNIIGQSKSSFNLREIMDNKKILLVNLSKGRTGDLNSQLLGMIFVMKFQAAAMSRANILEDDRVDFCLYVDEFQNFSTDSFATILSEARKYRLNLIVANQFTTQLTEEIRDAVFGNIGTVVSFRIGQNDVEALGKYFHPTFDSDDLLRIPNYNAVVRTLVGGVPTQPFSMATLPALGRASSEVFESIKKLSLAKYGRPRTAVEQEIFARLAVQTSVSPQTQSSFGPPAGRPAVPPRASGGSFLDGWMSKQKTTPMPPAQPPTSVRPQAPAPFTAPTPPSQAYPAVPPQYPPQAAPEVVGNVSSSQLDQQEVDGVATELRREFNLGDQNQQPPQPNTLHVQH